MPDMLVPLLKLPPVGPALEAVRSHGVTVRRANPWEVTPVLDFVRRKFSQGWADETGVAFAAKPVTAFVATLEQDVIGFAAYECTRRDYFGPTGVAKAHRNKGIGRALLVASLHGLRELGYAYAVIGGAGPVDFYAKAVGATVIPESVPGIYTDMLRRPPDGT